MDVLSLTIPLTAAYASANDLDKMDRRKSPQYLDLFRNTREAARAEMARTGWTTATYRCDVSVIRYCPHRGFKDAGNLGKAELDALSPSTAQQHVRDRCETFPGVWSNDALARPYHADIEYDPDGPDRVVIIVRRRFPDAIDAPATPRKPRAPKPAKAVVEPVAQPAEAPEERVAMLDGKPIPYASAIKLIEESARKRR